jgi:hypothetical protein
MPDANALAGVYAGRFGWVMPSVGGLMSTWNVNDEPAAVKAFWTLPARSDARTAIEYTPVASAEFRFAFVYVNVAIAPGADS